MNDEKDNSELIDHYESKYPPIVVEKAPEPILNYDIYGPRLVIDKIELENFKSYGGIKTLGPFHTNFNSIIGPNGSGKSNVIDALLFVFGFRTFKIRSKKLSVLIHKSELFPDVSSCSVKVFFRKIKSLENEDKEYEVIPNSEFVVSRTAFQDNSSEYEINGEKSNRKHMSKFLKDQGIDLDHNRFLILQGEVELIAQMKPKASTEHDEGLLEYIEDIIGSSRFKEPLKILFKRIEELSELRKDKLSHVKFLESEKKELEVIRNEAIKYLRLYNEIAIRKNICFQLKMRDLRLLEVSATENLTEVKEELEKMTTEIEKKNRLRLDNEKELERLVQEHLTKKQESESIHEKFGQLEVEDTEMRDNHKHCRIKIDEITKLIRIKKKEMLRYKNVPEEATLRIAELTEEIKQLEESKVKENENLEKAQISLRQETSELQTKRDMKSETLRKQLELINKQENEISSLKCHLEFLVGSYRKEEESLSNLKSNLKEKEDHFLENRKKLINVKDEIQKINKDYQETIYEMEKLNKMKTKLKTEVNQLVYTFETSQSEEKEQKAISFLLSQQIQNKLTGVIGRLGHLASVDRKYEIALSTACKALDAIVVKDMDTATKCVNLLRKHNFGRSTFIALDKIQIWQKKANQPFTEIPDAPRVFDLLNIPDNSLRAAFYSVFKDQLISKDLNSSMQKNQGEKHFKFLTLKGDILHENGSMTGGDRLIKGKICVDPSKIYESGQLCGPMQNLRARDIEQTIREKQEKLDDICNKLTFLESTFEKLKTDLTMANRNEQVIQQIQKDLIEDKKILVEEINFALERLKKMKPNEKEVQLIETKLDKLNKKYQKDYELINEIKMEIDEVNNEIKSFGFSKLDSIITLVNSIDDEIKDKSNILKKIQISVKKADKICRMATVDIERLTVDKTNHEESFLQLDTTMKELEGEAESLLNMYNMLIEEVDVLVKQKDQYQKNQNEINEDLRISQEVYDQMTREYQEKESKAKEIRQHIQQIESEIKKLGLYSITEEMNEEDNRSFMDLIGEKGGDITVFSSHQDSHNETKLKTYNEEELLALKVHQITYQDIEDKLIEKNSNLVAIEEYRKKEKLYMERVAELCEITQVLDYQREQYEKMKQERLKEFCTGFNLISGKLKEIYQLITMGGDAELELVDSLDPFSEGVLFSVRPPRKSWKNISNLSGGEKTLSSLALVFTLHYFKPTPFYVMDEIDAALDFKNVSIAANYIKENTKNSQFIIISLRNNMYELSNRLIGITKPFNVSKVCVVDPGRLAKCLKSFKSS